MKFEIVFAIEALHELATLRKYDQKRIRDSICRHLEGQADQETRNRKRLQEHPVAEWELRIEPFRVFYDLDTMEHRVRIKAIGYKERNKLYLLGSEEEL